MDFEIEDDSGEFTPYGHDPYSFKASGNSKSGSKKSGLFGGGDDEADAYDFQYETDNNFSKKGKSSNAPAPIPAFSPRPEQGKHHATQPKQDMSALDRAKEMLQKYNKPAGGVASSSQSASNKYKTGRASLSFDEDELSAEDDEEESEAAGEYGDLSISSPGTALKNFKPSTQLGAALVPPKLSSTSASAFGKPGSNSAPATTKSVSTGVTPASTDSKHQSSALAKPAINKSIQEVEESIDEVDEDDDEYEDDLEDAEESGKDDDEDKYDDEEFDDIDEDVDESDDNKPVTKNKNTRSNSGSDQDNASYSRMVYGNEDDDEDDVYSESLEESKPKILSFADLAEVAGWEAPSGPTVPSTASAVSQNNVTSVPISNAKQTSTTATSVGAASTYNAPVKPLVTVTEKPSVVTKMEKPTSTNSVSTLSAPVAPVDVGAVSKPSSVTAHEVNKPLAWQEQPAVANSTVLPPTVPSLQSGTSPRVNDGYTSVPKPSSVSPVASISNTSAPFPASATASGPPCNQPPYAPQPSPAAVPPSTGYPATFPPPYPGYTPYPYPFPTQEQQTGAGAASTNAFAHPYASFPYGMPQLPPHYSMGYHPAYPYLPMPYAGYPSPAAYGLYPPSMNMMGSLLASRTSSVGLGLGHFPIAGHQPPMESETSQRVIMDLLAEYNKVKDEAEWSKKKLADMIVLMEQQQHHQQSRGNQQQENSSAERSEVTKQQQAKAALLEKEDNVDESAVEYSMDFVEVSHLHGVPPVIATPRLQDPTEPKGNAVSVELPQHRPTVSSSVEASAVPLRQNLPATSSSWSSPKLRHSESSLANLLQGGTSKLGTNKENEPVASATLRSSLGSDPLTESVAKSFLASQELLRSKFEALRMKIQMSTTMHRSLREFDELQKTPLGDATTSSKPFLANSLDSFKQEAQRRREDDTRRLFALLREKYPELNPHEILEMANKFGSV